MASVKVIVLLCSLLCLVGAAEAGRVVVTTMNFVRSHHLTMLSIAKELANRNHDVLFVVTESSLSWFQSNAKDTPSLKFLPFYANEVCCRCCCRPLGSALCGAAQ
jgi:hypothetical protein